MSFKRAKSNKAANIALMCKSHNYTKNKTNENLFTSPSWALSETTANNLIGKNVILTNSSQTPAYMGGKIIDVVLNLKSTKEHARNTYGRCSNRYDIVFEYDPGLIGNKSSVGHSGWGSGRSVCYI